jgi:hypothetical protein
LAKILATEETFYRVREDVRGAHQRWLEARARNVRADDYLIPSGIPIAEAEKFASDHAGYFSESEHDYIGRSGQRARLRQRLLQTAVVAFALLAGQPVCSPSSRNCGALRRSMRKRRL